MEMSTILDALADGRDLSKEEAQFAFGQLMAGELPPAVAGAYLMGLRAKGETATELSAGVKEVLAKSRLVTGVAGAGGKRIDTCGTGGDGSCSFNCSTATALYLAALGYTVAKHGNRSVSSTCGSADIVEALGLPMPETPEEAAKALTEEGFAFLFAPAFHPAFRHIMPVRKELGVRTLFNMMGPLVNPARPTHQLLGVARDSIMQLMAEALSLTGVRRAAVVLGAGGVDELTPFGVNKVIWITGGADGSLVETELDPEALGIPRHEKADVAVSGKDGALVAMQAVLTGEGSGKELSAMRDMLTLNLGVALHLLEEDPLETCIARAREAVTSGAAARYAKGAGA